METFQKQLQTKFDQIVAFWAEEIIWNPIYVFILENNVEFKLTLGLSASFFYHTLNIVKVLNNFSYLCFFPAFFQSFSKFKCSDAFAITIFRDAFFRSLSDATIEKLLMFSEITVPIWSLSYHYSRNGKHWYFFPWDWVVL